MEDKKAQLFALAMRNTWLATATVKEAEEWLHQMGRPISYASEVRTAARAALIAERLTT
jgi:hypothetical protein